VKFLDEYRDADLAQQLAMNPGSVSRVLVRAGERRAASSEFARTCVRLERAVTEATP